MDNEAEKRKLWKTYGILMGVMLGGTILVLGGQSAWNAIQQRLAQSSVESQPPSATSSTISTPSAPTSTVDLTSEATPNSLTKLEAVKVINKYLQAKQKIFGSTFDRQVAAEVTTGKAYYEITRPGGRIDTLQKDNAYWKYGLQKAEPLAYFSATDNQAQINVKVTEELFYYENDRLKENQVNVKDYAFTLQLENGIWKIADRQEKIAN